jgi:PAS domain S-box-containing protein
MDAKAVPADKPDPDGSASNGAVTSPPTIEATDGHTADVIAADGFVPDGEALERYRTILQNIRDYAIYAVDPEGYITEWTEGAQKVKGYTPSEVVGQHFRMFHTPEDRAAGWPERFLAEAGRNGRAERESWHVRKGGGRFWANEIATAIRDQDGRLTGFTKISRDLTIQKVLERQQEESLAREREAREAAEAFMAVMSHELRTPVTTIYGTASLLTRDPDRADTRDLLADIEEEAERLVRIVDDLLVLSRVERGVVLLTPEPVLLRHVLTDVLAIVRRRYPSAQIEVQGSVPTPVLADATAVRQILHNLLTNAAKYAGRDGPIVLRLMETERWVEISILDSGPGLGDQPEDLFQLFYRSPHSARLASGTGIGLYVARQLVRAMGGSIDASTRPEGGASFVVRLPASRDTDDL